MNQNRTQEAQQNINTIVIYHNTQKRIQKKFMNHNRTQETQQNTNTIENTKEIHEPQQNTRDTIEYKLNRELKIEHKRNQ